MKFSPLPAERADCINMVPNINLLTKVVVVCRQGPADFDHQQKKRGTNMIIAAFVFPTNSVWN